MEQIIALGLAALGIIWLLLGQIIRFLEVQNSEAEKQVDDLKKAKEVRDELDNESPDARRRRLDGWMREDK